MAIMLENRYPHVWQHCLVSFKEGHAPEPVDFHSHSYYEISLILSGHVKTMLRHKSEDSSQCRLVLSAPGTPHLVFLSAPCHYARLNLYFEPDFVEHCVDEWGALSSLFGKNGNIINLSNSECRICETLIYDIMNEKSIFRKKLRILGFLSYVSEINSTTVAAESELPAPVMDAVTYINENYAKKLVASELARQVNISRTTLMTSIKKHTGLTFTEYVTGVRLKKAVQLLAEGLSQEETAARTGFLSGSGLNRAFRRSYGLTPGQYMKKLTK